MIVGFRSSSIVARPPHPTCSLADDGGRDFWLFPVVTEAERMAVAMVVAAMEAVAMAAAMMAVAKAVEKEKMGAAMVAVARVNALRAIARELAPRATQDVCWGQ